MPSISTFAALLVAQNPSLSFGLHHGLLNLTQTAHFLRPLVEARAGKPVQPSAILMALSRLQRQVRESDVSAAVEFQIDRISIQSGLCALTLAKSVETHRSLGQLFGQVQSAGGYMTLTEGTAEITVIMDEDYLSDAATALQALPARIVRRLAGLGIRINEQYIGKPGLLYAILQQIALQGLSVVEVTSTTSEFNVYLNDDDARLAFDSIYNRFGKRRTP
ncbi:MAG: hypothetical protein KJO98_00570 [Rhodothermia bacterium]|nr:hypothetical protein [Rhodothermia bacterium]